MPTAAATTPEKPKWQQYADDLISVATGTKAPTVNTEVGIEDESIYKMAGALVLVGFLVVLFWGIARHLSNK